MIVGSQRQRLGEILIEAGVLDASQLEQALAIQADDGRRLGSILLAYGFVAEPQLVQALSQQLSVPWVSLWHVDVPEELLELVPVEVALECSALPVYVRTDRDKGYSLYVAMDDPTNEEAIGRVSHAARMPVTAMVAGPSDIAAAIREFYGIDEEPQPAESGETSSSQATTVQIRLSSQVREARNVGLAEEAARQRYEADVEPEPHLEQYDAEASPSSAGAGEPSDEPVMPTEPELEASAELRDTSVDSSAGELGQARVSISMSDESSDDEDSQPSAEDESGGAELEDEPLSVETSTVEPGSAESKSVEEAESSEGSVDEPEAEEAGQSAPDAADDDDSAEIFTLEESAIVDGDDEPAATFAAAEIGDDEEPSESDASSAKDATLDMPADELPDAESEYDEGAEAAAEASDTEPPQLIEENSLETNDTEPPPDEDGVPQERAASSADQEERERPSRPPRRAVALTFLDGTTIEISGSKQEDEEGRIQSVPELVALLRASARGAALPKQLPSKNWEEYVANLIELLVRKRLLSEEEILEALNR